MEAAVANAQKELGRSCAELAQTLRGIAEKELAAARSELKQREEALEQRERDVALREVRAKASSQVPLTPTPSRSTRTAAQAHQAEVPKDVVQTEDWGLSPLRSSPLSDAASLNRKDSEAEPSPLASPAPSAREVDFASPAPKPRPAGVPILRLASTNQATVQEESKAAPVGQLKAMFESKAKSLVSTPARSERRAAGACSSIAAAASALQAAASPSCEEPREAAPQKLSLQDLLRQDEERSAAWK
mmetsp:Transcript_30674/g.55646  ORF Transcript_30674/g.55646 Transcript_30674/m.55646 type:complete len:246 (+) Transcript_30674:79-816(+)